jgi:hypothetical protein
MALKLPTKVVQSTVNRLRTCSNVVLILIAPGEGAGGVGEGEEVEVENKVHGLLEPIEWWLITTAEVLKASFVAVGVAIRQELRG